MTDITQRIKKLRQRINQTALACGRDPEDIRLIAVSKTRSAEDIRLAQAAGLCAFGENYLQEALEKITALETENLEWHFIGRIQSNKTRELANQFDWVQSVDRLKIAQRLNDQRGSWGARLNICVQVNISDEPQKAGASPENAVALCHAIAELPRLHLRGLMVIPQALTQPDAQLAAFQKAHDLYENLRSDGLELDSLSMGMSADLEAAIAAGSNMIRIGSDIFGPRTSS